MDEFEMRAFELERIIQPLLAAVRKMKIRKPEEITNVEEQIAELRMRSRTYRPPLSWANTLKLTPEPAVQELFDEINSRRRSIRNGIG